MPKQKTTPSASDFSDEEKAQIQRHGQALGGQPTDFDDEVEKELADHYPHEVSYQQMHQAQTSSDTGLGPSAMDTAAIKQRSALESQATTQSAVQAAQAQGAQTPVAPPAAPTGPAGTTQPYPAQRGAATSAGPAGGMPGPAPSAPPAAPGVGDEGGEEQEPTEGEPEQ